MPGAAPSAGDPFAGRQLTALSDAAFAALMAPLGPFGPSPEIMAGVSGGPHSLALALLLHRWARARGGTCLPVVVEHGLRAESAAEAAGVAALLAGQGMAPAVLPLGLPGGPGLQARARAGRYVALLGHAAALGVPYLALGHHAGDQAETLLLRAGDGSGPAGLAGMAAWRAAGAAVILRPLLGVPPARLEAVVAAAGLVPVRDPSNADPRFTRIRLRSALAEAPAAEAALGRAAGLFATQRAAVEAAQAARLGRCLTLHPEGFARIDLAALGRDAVAVAAFGQALRLVGGGEYAPGAAALRHLLHQGAGTLQGVQLGADGVLAREVASLAPPQAARPGLLWDRRWLVEATPPELEIGALGPAGEGPARPAWMPARVHQGLPALRAQGKLVAVPALGYAPLGPVPGLRLRLAPGGAALGAGVAVRALSG